MTGQLSLILGGVDVEPVADPGYRLLPVVRNHIETAERKLAARPDGRRVSKVCQPGYHKGRTPGNKGRTYPPEPVTAKDVQRLLAATGHGYAGARDRALYTFLWGTGEFRVVWTREGRRQSTRIYQSWSSACRKARGILALEAVKDETRFETMPDLVEPPVIQQRTVGEWETNPYYVPVEPGDGTKKEMLYLYGEPAKKDVSDVIPF